MSLCGGDGESELQNHIEDGTEIRFIHGSVLNLAHLDMVMSDFDIETAYHAAAYKHVPRSMDWVH